MLVKIVKCSLKSYWYHDCIGKIYNVDPVERIQSSAIYGYNVIGKSLFIQEHDCVALTEREVLLYEAEQAQKEFEAARCRFQEYERKNTITERDIVPGAKFTGKRKSLYVMINHVSRKDPYGKFLIGGAYGDPFITYSDDPKTRVEMVEHLIVLGAKKVENEI